MKTELLIMPDCPSRMPARRLLEDCMADLGVASQLIEIVVDTPELAQVLKFPGSPTMRVNDLDVEPGFEPMNGTLSCRTYRVCGHLQGMPDRDWVMEALRRVQEQESRACCSREGTPSGDELCPISGTIGKPVKAVTVRAMLRPDLQEQVCDEAYRFCGDPTCDVVYFKADGSQVFTKADVVTRVGIKESQPPRPLCYCFGHTFESIRDEWIATGRTTAIESIRSQIKEGGCRCEVTNPHGDCCLGDVARALKEIQDTVTLPAVSGSESLMATCHDRYTCTQSGASTDTRKDLALKDAKLPTIPDWTVVTAQAAREAVEGILEAGWRGKKFENLDASAVWVLATLLRLYADSGCPPSAARIADQADIMEGEVRRLLNDLHRHDLVILDGEKQTIRGAYPFTETVTGHSVTFTRTQQILNTMCFIDALGAAAMCRENAVIRSACRLCAVPVVAGVHDRGMTLDAVQPTSTVVWVGFSSSCGCAANSVCREIMPFCCDEHLERWKASEHGSEGRRLSVEEALQVGKSLFANRSLRSHK